MKQDAQWPKTVQTPVEQFRNAKAFYGEKEGKARKLGKTEEALDTPTWIVERKKERLNGSHYDSSGISEKRPIRNRCDCSQKVSQ